MQIVVVVTFVTSNLTSFLKAAKELVLNQLPNYQIERLYLFVFILFYFLMILLWLYNSLFWFDSDNYCFIILSISALGLWFGFIWVESSLSLFPLWSLKQLYVRHCIECHSKVNKICKISSLKLSIKLNHIQF